MESSVLREDFEDLRQDPLLDKEKLRGASVLVTGASGFIGSLLLRSLIFLNQSEQLQMQLYGMARSEDKIASIFTIEQREQIHFFYGDISAARTLGEGIPHLDYVFHTASVTGSKYMVTYPVQTIQSSVMGTDAVLQLAQDKGVRSLVYLSSMEMYGSFDENDPASRACNEKCLGYLDLQDVRSNYPESKRLCENLCQAYWSQYQLPVKIARLAQTFGAGVLPWDQRVFAQLAKAVMRGEDFVMHTKGLSEGNYCYSMDLVRGLFLILLRGEDGQAYNVVNEQTHRTIAQMAEEVLDALGNGKQKLVFDIPESNVYGYASDKKLRLLAGALRELGWKPKFDLIAMYDRLIRDQMEAEATDPSR